MSERTFLSALPAPDLILKDAPFRGPAAVANITRLMVSSTKI
jgi:hypothetical protein